MSSDKSVLILLSQNCFLEEICTFPVLPSNKRLLSNIAFICRKQCLFYYKWYLQKFVNWFKHVQNKNLTYTVFPSSKMCTKSLSQSFVAMHMDLNKFVHFWKLHFIYSFMFPSVCNVLIKSGERQDEDSIGGRRRTESLRLLAAMNPSQTLKLRALAVSILAEHSIQIIQSECWTLGVRTSNVGVQLDTQVQGTNCSFSNSVDYDNNAGRRYHDSNVS